MVDHGSIINGLTPWCCRTPFQGGHGLLDMFPDMFANVMQENVVYECGGHWWAT